MAWSIATELAWTAAESANKADTAVKAAENDYQDFQRLAALGLKGVSIEASAEAEAKERVVAAKNEFRTVLNMAAMVIKKGEDPFPACSQPVVERVVAPATVANRLRDISGPLIHWLSPEYGKAPVPVIGTDEFTTILNIASGRDLGHIGSRTFNSLSRSRPKGIFWHAAYAQHSERGYMMDVTELPELVRHAEENFARIPNFGQKSLDALRLVSNVVVENADWLLVQPASAES